MPSLSDYVNLGELYDEQFDRPAACRCDEQLITGAVCCECLNAGFGTPNTEVDR